MFTTKYSKNRNSYAGKSKKKGLKFASGGEVRDPKPPLKPGMPGTWGDWDQASGGGSGAETMPSAEERLRRRLRENAR